ncbi:MAG TPA: BamA/TamA family outer membrane protein [Polyangiales bacterium]
MGWLLSLWLFSSPLRLAAQPDVGVAPAVPSSSAPGGASNTSPSGPAPAQDAKASLRDVQVMSNVSYEQRRIDLILRQQKLELEDAPEGKRIAFVRVVRDDVFVKDEIWPLWFNWFHGRTRDYVVRRELLFAVGSSYDDDRIEETMRNLRSMAIFALVRIVPVRGEKPGEVGVLVHTRDLWSLRLETDFSITNNVVNQLVVRGTERNLFGHNKAVGADFTMLPKSYWIMQDYTARRVFNSSWRFAERAGPIFRRGTSKLEGERVTVTLGQPFYRLSQRLAWEATATHLRYVQRNTADGQVRLFPYPGNDPNGPFARQAWYQRQESASLLGYYRYGERVKSTFAAGWDFRMKEVHTLPETELPDELARSFPRYVMPVERTDNGPYFAYDFFVPRWATFVNLSTYGQSENVRLGPNGTLITRVPIGALGSTANAWVLTADLGLTLAPAGFYLDMKVSGTSRLMQGEWIDQLATFMVRGATPVFWYMRFATRAYVELRRRDSQRTYVSLGADNGLRGYPSAAIAQIGADRFLANFELRTLPIAWQAIHVGAVLFYDVGSVFTQNQPVKVHHSVGVGLRILFPQLNRTPFSVDAGMSFNQLYDPVVATFTAGQSIPLTAAEDPVP